MAWISACSRDDAVALAWSMAFVNPVQVSLVDIKMKLKYRLDHLNEGVVLVAQEYIFVSGVVSQNACIE